MYARDFFHVHRLLVHPTTTMTSVSIVCSTDGSGRLEWPSVSYHCGIFSFSSLPLKTRKENWIPTKLCVACLFLRLCCCCTRSEEARLFWIILNDVLRRSNFTTNSPHSLLSLNRTTYLFYLRLLLTRCKEAPPFLTLIPIVTTCLCWTCVCLKHVECNVAASHHF